MRRTLRTRGLGTVAATLGLGSLLAATPANAAPNTITMWVDQKRIANYREVFPGNTYAGYTINLVPKDFGKLRDDLATVVAVIADLEQPGERHVGVLNCQSEHVGVRLDIKHEVITHYDYSAEGKVGLRFGF